MSIDYERKKLQRNRSRTGHLLKKLHLEEKKSRTVSSGKLAKKGTSKYGIFLVWAAFGLVAIWWGLIGQMASDYGNEVKVAVRADTDAPGDAISDLDVVFEGEIVRATAFSSQECRTTWCRNNPERQGHQVALHGKFGNASKVFIPRYGRTYDVVGTTEHKTDLDIYFGTDYDGAREFGVQYLEIQIL